MDTFDKIRTTIAQIKAPISCGLNWYSSFDTPDGMVPHKAEGLLGGHDVKICGFTVKNGVEVVAVQNSWGEGVGDKGLFYFDRWATNQYLGKFGMGYWTDATDISVEQYTIFETIIKNMRAIVQLLINSLKPSMKPVEPQPIIPIDEVIPPPAQPSEIDDESKFDSPYDWSTPVTVRHSVRVICDEEGLSVADKNVLCACVQVESGFNPKAVHYNQSNPSQGAVTVQSIDYGICQINDKWNIGSGKPFPSSDYVLQNPEACIRWMCKMWKAGKQSLWASYTNGSYKKYL